MSRATFNTVSTELLEHAEAVHSHYRSFGYNTKIEPYEIHFPNRPTLVVMRPPTQTAVIVCGRIDMQELRHWVTMAKSMSSDFRITICLPSATSSRQLAKHQLQLQSLGIGILVSGPQGIASLADPVDQGINVTLPDLKQMPRPVAKVLGPAYEHFNGGRWRDCFEEACTALEQEVRPYLKRAIKTGRLTVLDAHGQPKNPSPERIEKMTLGQLAVTIANAHPLNGTDSLVQRALAQINPDRVGAVHKNRKVTTERRLRKNVGMHMHAIIQAVRELKR